MNKQNTQSTITVEITHSRSALLVIPLSEQNDKNAMWAIGEEYPSATLAAMMKSSGGSSGINEDPMVETIDKITNGEKSESTTLALCTAYSRHDHIETDRIQL
jgi:hypothetical protein